MAIQEEGVPEYRDAGPRQNERKLQETESCVWGVDDIKTEKRKIRVQSKNKKRKRAGQMKVRSRQETVVYFPKSDKESTNRG